MGVVLTKPERDTTDALGDDGLMTGVEVAKALRVTRRSLSSWVREGRFPKPDVTVSATVKRWRRGTVRSWVTSAAK